MIVQRLTAKLKHFRKREWIQAIQATDPHPERTRIYTSRFGPEDVVLWAHEFDDLSQIDAYWKEWMSGVDMGEWRRKFEEATEENISNEIWTMVEWPNR